LRDTNGNPISQARIRCEGEGGVVEVENGTCQEGLFTSAEGFSALTDPYGNISGDVFCGREGSFQFWCSHGQSSRRAVVSIKCTPSSIEAVCSLDEEEEEAEFFEEF